MVQQSIHPAKPLMMARFFLTSAALLAGLAVAAGAFATHALRAQLSDRALAIFETAVRYQMYHALALLLVGVLLSRAEAGVVALTVTGWAFLAGIVLFSGSLYGLSLAGIKVLGAIAPVGGLALMMGWLCLAIGAWNYQQT